MEYALKGTLEDAIKLSKGMPIETVRHFTAEIILALERLHSEEFCHRDLKPGNILFDEKHHLKLCDFGEAKETKGINRDLMQDEYEKFLKKSEEEKEREAIEDDDEEYPSITVDSEPFSNADDEMFSNLRGESLSMADQMFGDEVIDQI